MVTCENNIQPLVHQSYLNSYSEEKNISKIEWNKFFWSYSPVKCLRIY